MGLYTNTTPMSSHVSTSSRAPAGLEQASQLLEEGLYQEAAGLFNRVLLKDAGNIRALVGLARSYVCLGEAKTAKKYVDKARELDPKHIGLVEVWAQLLLSKNRPEKALEILEPAILSDDVTARINVLLGETLEKLGKLAPALDSFERALAIDPSTRSAVDGVKRVFEQGVKTGLFKDDPERLKNLGFKYLREDKKTLAIGLFQHAAQMSLHDTDMYLTMGHHLGEKEMFTQAIEGYHKVLEYKPDQPDALSGLALAQAMQGNLNAALDSINQAIIFAPTRPEFHVYRGDLMRQVGNLQESLRSFYEALKLKPDDAQVMFSLANTHAKLGNEMEALELYQKVLQINGYFSIAYLNLFQIHERRKVFPEAARCLREFRRLNPDDVRGAVRALSLLEAQGRYRQMVVAAGNEIARFGRHPDLLLNQGVGHLGLEEPEKAKVLFKEVVRDFKMSGGALNNLGVIAEKEGKIEKAKIYYDNALKVEPKLAEAHYNIGCILVKQEKIKDAAERFKRTIEYDPYMAQAYHNLGTCLRALEKHDEAKAILRRGLGLAEKVADSRLALGQSELATGNADQALESLQALISENPDYEQTMDLLLSLWRVQRERGNLEAAARACEGALHFDKTSVEATLALAITMDESGKLDNAERLYMKVLTLDQQNSPARMNLGIHYFDKRRDPVRALRFAQEACDKDPKNFEARYNLGILKAQIGFPKEAVNELEVALELNPHLHEACLALGELLHETHPASARSYLEQAAMLAPKSWLAWHNLGVMQATHNQYDDALESVERALSIKDDPTTLFNKGVLYDLLGYPGESIDAYCRSRDLQPEGDTYFNLGELNERMGETSRSKLHYLEAIRKYPGYVPARVHMARIVREEGDHADALRLLEDALTAEPDNDAVVYNISLLLIAASKVDRAIKLVDDLLSRKPDVADHHVLRASIRLLQEDFDGTLAAARKALDLDSRHLVAQVHEALALEGLGRYDEAIQGLVFILEMSPDLIAAYLILSRIYQRLENLGEQEAWLRRALHRDPAHPDVLLALADAQILAGRYEDALQALNDFPGSVPHRPLVLTSMGKAYFRLRRYEEAAAQFKEASELRPLDRGLIFNHALSLYRLDRPKECLKVIRDATLRPTAGMLHLKGLAFACLGSRDEERQAYEEAHELDPLDPKIRLNLAGVLFEDGRIDEVELLLADPALEDHPAAIWIRALLAESRGEVPQALELYERAGSAETPVLEAWLAAGLLLRLQGAFPDETRCYRIARDLGHSPDMCHLLLGQAHLLKGQVKRGIAYLEKVGGELEGVARALRGSALITLERYPEALAILEQARKQMDQDVANLIYNQVLCHVALGQKKEARERFEETQFPVPFPGLYLLDSVLTGDGGGQAKLEKGLETFRDHEGLLVAMGNHFVAHQDPMAALEHYTRALSIAPENPPPFLVANLGHLITLDADPLLALRALADLAGTSYRRFRSALRRRPNHDNGSLLLQDRERFGPRFDPNWFEPER